VRKVEKNFEERVKKYVKPLGGKRAEPASIDGRFRLKIDG